jgi:hypothetical protein
MEQKLSYQSAQNLNAFAMVGKSGFFLQVQK